MHSPSRVQIPPSPLPAPGFHWNPGASCVPVPPARVRAPGSVRACGVKGLFALWGVGVVVEASRGSWTVSWDDDRTQEFTLGASSTKTRMQFGYPNFLQRPKTLQFQRCDFNV